MSSGVLQERAMGRFTLGLCTSRAQEKEDDGEGEIEE